MCEYYEGGFLVMVVKGVKSLWSSTNRFSCCISTWPLWRLLLQPCILRRRENRCFRNGIKDDTDSRSNASHALLVQLGGFFFTFFSVLSLVWLSTRSYVLAYSDVFSPYCRKVWCGGLSVTELQSCSKFLTERRRVAMSPFLRMIWRCGLDVPYSCFFLELLWSSDHWERPWNL